MFVDWPFSVLRHWRTEWGEDEHVVFRGPRCGADGVGQKLSKVVFRGTR